MKIAALTFAYNESVNLLIWRRYYGEQLGEENLFLIDHGSDDVVAVGPTRYSVGWKTPRTFPEGSANMNRRPPG